MLSKARHYLENDLQPKFKNWYFRFLPVQSSVFSPDRCCLSIDQGKLTFLHARKQDAQAEILLHETFDYSQTKDIKVILTRLVQEHHLANMRCSWILKPDQYQLLQTETLPVPPNEFQSAIRWKVKDLLRFPVEDAMIDSFSVPRAKQATSLETIMLVVGRASELMPLSNLITASGLRLTTIDIPELSFRNLTAVYENDEKSTAMIYMQEDYSQLIMTSQQQLYFARRLDCGLNSLNQATTTELTQSINEMALDLQRSFDYYQSQWRQPEPARVFFESVAHHAVDVSGMLSQRLNRPVKAIELERYFKQPEKLNIAQEGYYLPLLGGILREWEASYVARN